MNPTTTPARGGRDAGWCGMSGEHVVLNERTAKGDETGAGLMRNRCAFTSRDMAADWPEAFTYAVVYGWGKKATKELTARYGWDDDLVAFLKDAHKRFRRLADKHEEDR